MVKNVTVENSEFAFRRYRKNFKKVGNLRVTNSLQDFDAKESALRIDQSRSETVEKRSVSIIFECSQDAGFKMCRLEFRFQSLPLPSIHLLHLRAFSSDF